MKKIILALCVLGLCASTANAACVGGTEANGFCVSDINLNWWSASAWCQANGRHLATMYEVCPNWDGNTGNGKCNTLKDSYSRWGWSATVAGGALRFLSTTTDA